MIVKPVQEHQQMTLSKDRDIHNDRQITARAKQVVQTVTMLLKTLYRFLLGDWQLHYAMH